MKLLSLGQSLSWFDPEGCGEAMHTYYKWGEAEGVKRTYQRKAEKAQLDRLRTKEGFS